MLPKQISRAFLFAGVWILSSPHFASAQGVPISAQASDGFYSIQLRGVSSSAGGENVAVTIFNNTSDTSAFGSISITNTVTSAVLLNQTFRNTCSCFGTNTITDAATLTLPVGSYSMTLTAHEFSSASVIYGSKLEASAGWFNESPDPTFTTNFAIVSPPTIDATSLPNGTVGRNYGPVVMTETGGVSPFTWTGAGLPQGVTISTGGVISGIPSAVGNFTVSITVTDGAENSASKSLSISVLSDVIPISVTGYGNLGATSVGKPAGTGTFTASGGKPPYAWSISGAPAGINLSSSSNTATVSGAPTQAGVFSFTVTAADSAGQRASGLGSVSVLGLNTPALPAATAFAPYTASLSAVGGQPPYSFHVTGLPSGLSITGEGAFRGSPQKDGNFIVAVTVNDAGGNSATGTLSLIVNPAPPLSLSGNLPGGTLNASYSASLAASGGAPPYSFSVAGGALPDGLRLSTVGTVSGIPTATGSFAVTVRLTDSSGGSVTGNYIIVVTPPPVNITTAASLPSGMAGTDYPVQTVNATGGIGPYIFTVASGSLPGGITLSPTGLISGVPSAAGSFTFSASAKDTTGLTGTASFSIEVRPSAPDLMLSTASLTFTIPAGAASLPPDQSVRVQSTVVSQVLNWSAAISSSASWLTLSRAGGTTPASFAVTLTNSALLLASSGSPYSTTIAISCTAAPYAGKTQNVTVTLNVPSLPPQLSVGTNSLSFTGLSTAPVTSSQGLALSNIGGGSLGVGSVTCAAAWCKVSGVPAQLSAGTSQSLTVTADPSVSGPGYFWSSVEIVTSGGKASVPVTLFVAARPGIALAPSGFLATLPAGGTLSVPDTSFNITVSTLQTITWNATVTGASWLKLGASNGTASGNSPATVDFSFDTAALSQLSQGTYYNSIQVTSGGVINSPQDFTVVVNVTPAGERQKPNPSPAGLLFITPASASPPAQQVGLYTSSNSPEQFQASVFTLDGGSWLSVTPATGVTSPANTVQISVSADPSKLKPGVYRGQVDFAFAGNAVRSENVTLVVTPIPATSPITEPLARHTSALSTTLLPHAGCSPTQLVPTQTGLPNNFSAPTAWPVPLEIILVNDCGDPVTAGQIVTTFSNGDPPLALTLADPKSATYSATWTPRKPSAQVTIAAQATIAGLPPATIKLITSVTPSNAPVLNNDAVLNIYNPVGGVPTAPGTLVVIKGSYLASLPATNTAIPVPTALGGTRVLIGGVAAPVTAVSPSQVSVQVPFELKAGQPYQVVISANGALTTPDGLQVADASPGLSLLPSGFVNATHQSGDAITEASPAKPGELIAIYLAGMGLTAVPIDSGTAPSTSASVLIQPDIAVGGLPVTYLYAGLTPGLVGVYQINMQVPDNTPDGNQPLQLSQAGAPSNSGLLPVKK